MAEVKQSNVPGVSSDSMQDTREKPFISDSSSGVTPPTEERLEDEQAPAPRADGKIELTEPDCYDILGFSYPTTKKWTILTIIFIVQVSLNFNASVYANAVKELSTQFSISEQGARVGQMIFLVAYAFGSELWAPWSEELGRWPILQLSLLLVNIWQIPCALAPNFGTIVVCRFLGGLSSAGGSVTLGMVADMWEADDQQYAVAFVVLSSVGGSVVGPIVGKSSTFFNVFERNSHKMNGMWSCVIRNLIMPL